MKFKRDYLILAGILIFAFVLRVWSLGNSPMWIDETISSLAAEKILETGFPRFDSGVFYSRAIIFHYLSAGFLWLIGGYFGARFVSVIFGVLTVGLAFFIGREFGKDNVAGLVAAVFSAVLFLEVVYSRQARFYQMFQFLFFLVIYFLYKSKERKLFAWLACVGLVLLVETHIAGVVVLPLFFYVFWKEQREWKLFVAPTLVGVYFLKGIWEIFGTASAEFAVRYAENYGDSIWYYLGAFVLISLIGIYFAFKKNKRLCLMLIVPSLFLVFGLFFLKVFAVRYAYFIILLVPIFLGAIFSFIYKNWKIMFWIVLIFSLVYPSNLFFGERGFSVILPSEVSYRIASEPILDYDFSEEIVEGKNVVLFTPAFEWNFKKPDYFVSFSLNGMESGYAVVDGKDVYTGVDEFDFKSSGIGEFNLVEDAFGYGKLDNAKREKWDKLKENCEIVGGTASVKVYSC